MSVAIVTGGSRGIGRAVAEELARRGHDLALFARDRNDVEKAAREIAGSTARRAIGLSCDVSKTTEVANAYASVEAAFGAEAVDVIVHSAGLVHRVSVAETTDDQWDAVLDANLKGVFVVTRAFLPGLLARKRGRIVVVGSISSTLGTPRLGAYCAAKWGVVGFTKALAEELRGTGVAVLSVLPGSVDTRMLEGSGFIPAMSPAEVAKTVVFAALDAPAAMNASAIEMFGP